MKSFSKRSLKRLPILQWEKDIIGFKPNELDLVTIGRGQVEEKTGLSMK
jgi:hypothetical protein